MRNEALEDGSGGTEQLVYRISRVPKGHKNVQSDDLIHTQLLERCKVNGEMVYTNSKTKYADHKSRLFMSVDPSEFDVVQGKTTNASATGKSRLAIRFDLPAFWQRVLEREAAGEETKEGDDEAADTAAEPDVIINPMSIEEVLGNCPDFKNVRSMVQERVEAVGHILMLSANYHWSVRVKGSSTASAAANGGTANTIGTLRRGCLKTPSSRSASTS